MEKIKGVNVFHIEWDIEPSDEENELPDSVFLSFESENDSEISDFISNRIADILSDRYEYCINGFSYELVGANDER